MKLRSASLSISDDDLCATCRHLAYSPGDMSTCQLKDATNQWPADFDENQYAKTCGRFAPVLAVKE